MQMTLIPVGADNSYDGNVDLAAMRIRDVPTFALLLDAISVFLAILRDG